MAFVLLIAIFLPFAALAGMLIFLLNVAFAGEIEESADREPFARPTRRRRPVDALRVSPRAASSTAYAGRLM